MDAPNKLILTDEQLMVNSYNDKEVAKSLWLTFTKDEYNFKSTLIK